MRTALICLIPTGETKLRLGDSMSFDLSPEFIYDSPNFAIIGIYMWFFFGFQKKFCFNAYQNAIFHTFMLLIGLVCIDRNHIVLSDIFSECYFLFVATLWWIRVAGRTSSPTHMQKDSKTNSDKEWDRSFLRSIILLTFVCVSPLIGMIIEYCKDTRVVKCIVVAIIMSAIIAAAWSSYFFIQWYAKQDESCNVCKKDESLQDENPRAEDINDHEG